MILQSEILSGDALWHWRRVAIATILEQTLDQTLDQTQDQNIAAAEVDWFLRELLGWDQLALRLHCAPSAQDFAAPVTLSALDQLWQRRITERVPVQYLLGRTPWRNFTLEVSPAVLIPRPETELIVDLAVQRMPTALPSFLPQRRWADLGTGSGAIAIGLAQVLPTVEIHAVDLCPQALAVAQANAQRLQFTPQIQFHQGSWWSPLQTWQGEFEAMVSNPPYIPRGLIPGLQAEVNRHEPHLALDGGEDGLTSIQSLIDESPQYLVPGGLWIVELMAGQAPIVAERLRQNGNYQDIQTHTDWAGIERFLSAIRMPENPLN